MSVATKLRQMAEQGYLETDWQEQFMQMADELEGAVATDTKCEWRMEDPDGYGPWTTDCGRAWEFIDGDPEDNSVDFCFGCGKPVSAIQPKERE